MSAIEAHSRVTMPLSPTADQHLVPKTYADSLVVGGGSGTSDIMLGSQMQPVQKFVTPIPGAAGSPVVKDVINTTVPATEMTGYVTPTFYGWNSGVFSAPPCNWVAVGAEMSPPSSPNTPCINKSTPRTHFATPNFYGSTHEFEFVIVGKRFSLQWKHYTGYTGNNKFDCQIYVYIDGELQKLRDLPLCVNAITAYRHVEFAEARVWRVRVILPGHAWFHGVWVDAATVTYAPPLDRPIGFTDGDSYFEASNGAYDDAIWNSGNANGMTDFQTFDIVTAIMEATTFWLIRGGCGGTGFFNANDGQAHTVGEVVNGTSVFLSDQRFNWTNTYYMNKLLSAYIINGTQNDGTLSGGGVLANCQSGMHTRALAGYSRIRAVDALVPIIQVGPEPFKVFGTEVDPGTNHDKNRLGQIDAVMETSKAFFIDPLNPIDWTTGTGNNSPTGTSQQGRLIGPNGIHMNYLGKKYYGTRIAQEMAKIPVSSKRLARVA
jgi:hypothetical protein